MSQFSSKLLCMIDFLLTLSLNSALLSRVCMETEAKRVRKWDIDGIPMGFLGTLRVLTVRHNF